jgi:hypothetical protein
VRRFCEFFALFWLFIRFEGPDWRALIITIAFEFME